MKMLEWRQLLIIRNGQNCRVQSLLCAIMCKSVFKFEFVNVAGGACGIRHADTISYRLISWVCLG